MKCNSDRSQPTTGLAPFSFQKIRENLIPRIVSVLLLHRLKTSGLWMAGLELRYAHRMQNSTAEQSGCVVATAGRQQKWGKFRAKVGLQAPTGVKAAQVEAKNRKANFYISRSSSLKPGCAVTVVECCLVPGGKDVKLLQMEPVAKKHKDQ